MFSSFGQDLLERNFSVQHRHRTWNHICWTLDSNKGDVQFFFNGGQHQSSMVPNKYFLQGYEKQFLVFGQEPDAFKGGFDKYQLLQGKVSQFNWWNSILDEDYIKELALCTKVGNGNIVNWTKGSFQWFAVEVEDIDPGLFCDSTEKWLFFPGRRRRDQASVLCDSHGGQIVAPKSPEENFKAMRLYKDNLQECQQKGSNIIGWLGVNLSQNEHVSPDHQSNRTMIPTNFNNFKK